MIRSQSDAELFLAGLDHPKRVERRLLKSHLLLRRSIVFAVNVSKLIIGFGLNIGLGFGPDIA